MRNEVRPFNGPRSRFSPDPTTNADTGGASDTMTSMESSRKTTLARRHRFAPLYLLTFVLAAITVSVSHSLTAKAANEVARADRFQNLHDSRYGTYRIHGWWARNENIDSNGYYWDQFVLGEDSRTCDGCSYFNIWSSSTHTRAWACGNKEYDRTINEGWKAYNGVSTNYYQLSSNNYSCGPQADVTGYSDTGQVHWSFYLNEKDSQGTCRWYGRNAESCPPPA